MPELPEVETVRQGLLEALKGHRLTVVSNRRPDLRIPFPDGFAERLVGRRVDDIERRAKYLLAYLDDGNVLIMHLGMSGRFLIEPTGAHMAKLGPHEHVVMETDIGTRIIYRDHRRFGLMTLASADALDRHPLLGKLGIEPLSADFTPDALMTALRGKGSPIKGALLDQRVVAGLGNIYVCEALFRSRVSPRRRSDTVAGRGAKPTQRAIRLVSSIKDVLRDAIEAGGSTLRDYAHTDGKLGYFQHAFAVYDREGEACQRPDCDGHIKRIVQAGRSTFFCSACQR